MGVEAWRERVKSRSGAIVCDDLGDDAIYIARTDAPKEMPNLEIMYILVNRPVEHRALKGLRKGVYVAVNVSLEDLEKSEHMKDTLESHVDEFFKNENQVPLQIKGLVNITNSLMIAPVRGIGDYLILEVSPMLPSQGVKIFEAQKRGISISALNQSICDN